MTSLEKIKYMKTRGYPLQFIARKSKINYHRLYRALRGGNGLNAAECHRIQRVFDLVEAFENE